MKDMASQTDSMPLIVPASRTTDSTDIWVDTRGFDSVTIEIALGVGGITFDSSNKIEFKLYESADSGGSGANLVGEADIIGAPAAADDTGIILSLVAAHAAAANYVYGYRGSKRYIALKADFTGTHGAGTPMAASAILGHPRNSPIAN